MAKAKTMYVCSQCGYETPRWLGRCPDCGSWNTLTEQLAAPAAPEGEMLFLREQISRWPPRERLLFTRRFVEGCTQQEIAQELGLSQVQVSRLLKKLCTALRGLLQEGG